MNVGDIVYFLTSFPHGELQRVKLINKEENGKWFFQKECGGHDKTREQFLLNIPNASREFPSIMGDEEAFSWAWEQVQKDHDLNKLTISDSVCYNGFMRIGWNYREQLTKQRNET